MIEYDSGIPEKNGVYACRIPTINQTYTLLEDKFLLWYDGEWSHLRSDQKYRGKVLGWIGPLQRKLRE